MKAELSSQNGGSGGCGGGGCGEFVCVVEVDDVEACVEMKVEIEVRGNDGCEEGD